MCAVTRHTSHTTRHTSHVTRHRLSYKRLHDRPLRPDAAADDDIDFDHEVHLAPKNKTGMLLCYRTRKQCRNVVVLSAQAGAAVLQLRWLRAQVAAGDDSTRINVDYYRVSVLF